MQRELDHLLNQVRSRIRFKHYSLRREEAYVDWVRRFARFHDGRHPAELGAADLERFLTHLAIDLGVAASTQNQAQSALLFLYRDVLSHDMRWLDGIVRAKAPARLPVVLSVDEVAKLLACMTAMHRLLGELLYGTGMRILEGLRLRVKDIDFGRGEILVRDGKGAKDRITMLPRRLFAPLRRQVARARAVHEQDLAEGFGVTSLPCALARKYPLAAREWAWQYVFPADRRAIDPRSGQTARHRVSEQSARSTHTSLNRGGRGVASPLDRLHARDRHDDAH
jgi:integron integrase